MTTKFYIKLNQLGKFMNGQGVRMFSETDKDLIIMECGLSTIAVKESQSTEYMIVTNIVKTDNIE